MSKHGHLLENVVVHPVSFAHMRVDRSVQAKAWRESEKQGNTEMSDDDHPQKPYDNEYETWH